MIKEISESELPEELKLCLNGWQEYFRKQVESQPFDGINWQGQDKNMKAHNSKEEYIEWFASDPDKYNMPYKGDGFYVRELTMLSSFARPKNIIEMGTNLGMGTRMLSLLNHDAVITTIDNRELHKHEGDKDYPVGYLAGDKSRIIQKICNSWEYLMPACVDLCFIDADHTAGSVLHDSETAWMNKNAKRWVIIWHDYWKDDPRFHDYCKAIKDFLEEKKQIAYHFKGSTTLWAYGDQVYL